MKQILTAIRIVLLLCLAAVILFSYIVSPEPDIVVDNTHTDLTQ